MAENEFMKNFVCITDTKEWPEWSEIYDPASQAYYYYNNYSGVSLWDKPESFVNHDSTTDANGQQARGLDIYPPYMRCVIKIQSTFRSKKARKALRIQRATRLAASAATENESSNKWSAILDPATGAYYYYNSETGECTWEKPEELKENPPEAFKVSSSNNKRDAAQEIPTWVEVYDPASKAYYYYNNYTGESTWDKPENFERKKMSNMADLMSPELKAAISIQSTFRAKRARKKMRIHRGIRASSNVNENNGNPTTMKWSTILDPITNQYYYFNWETQECKWDMPEELASSSHVKLDRVEEESKEMQAHPKSKEEDQGLKLRAVLKIQVHWRIKVAKRALRVQRAKVNSTLQEDDSSVWEKYFDPQSGYEYYYNAKTGQVSWEIPDEKQPAATKIQSFFRMIKSLNAFWIQRKLLRIIKENWCVLHVILLECTSDSSVDASANIENYEIKCCCFDGVNEHVRERKSWNIKQNGVALGDKERGVLPTDVITLEKDDVVFKTKVRDLLFKLAQDYNSDPKLLKPGISSVVWIGAKEKTEKPKDAPPNPNASMKLKISLKVLWGLQEECEWIKVSAQNGNKLYYNIPKQTCFQTKPENSIEGIGGVEVSEKDIQKGVERYNISIENKRIEYRNKVAKKHSQLIKFATAEDRDLLISEVRRVSAAELSGDVTKRRLEEFKKLLEFDLSLNGTERNVLKESIDSCESLLKATTSRCKSAKMEIVKYKGQGQAESYVLAAVEESCSAEAQLVVTAQKFMKVFESLLKRELDVLNKNLMAGTFSEVMLPIRLCFRVKTIQNKSKSLEEEIGILNEALVAFVSGASQRARLDRLIQNTTVKGIASRVIEQWTEINDTLTGLKTYTSRISNENNQMTAPWEKPMLIREHDSVLVFENEDGSEHLRKHLVQTETKLSIKTATTRWWQSNLVLIERSSILSSDIAKVRKEIQALLDSRMKEQQQREDLVKKAEARAKENHKREEEYELLCRAKFVKICQSSWSRGIKIREEEKLLRNSNDLFLSKQISKQSLENSSEIPLVTYRTPIEAIKNDCSIDEFAEALAEARKRREFQEKRIYNIDLADPETGEILIHTACWHGRKELVEMLIKLGSNLRCIVSLYDKSTCLHIAVKAGNNDMLKYLISKGAPLDAEDNNGDTALHLACREGAFNTVRVLLDSETEEIGQASFWRMIMHRNKNNRLASQLIFCNGAFEKKNYRNWIKHRVSALLWAHEERAKEKLEHFDDIFKKEFLHIEAQRKKKKLALKSKKKRRRGRGIEANVSLKPISWSVG